MPTVLAIMLSPPVTSMTSLVNWWRNACGLIRPGRPYSAPRPAQHASRRVRGPRLASGGARQLDQQHAVRGGVPPVLRGHVDEVATDHCRADQVDLPFGHHAVDHSPVRLDLRRCPVGIAPAMAHVHVWRLAVPALRILAQVQIGQVKARQPPIRIVVSDSQVTTIRSRAVFTAPSRPCRAPSGSIFG